MAKKKGSDSLKYREADQSACQRIGKLQFANPALTDWQAVRAIAPTAAGFDNDNSHNGKTPRRLYKKYTANKAMFIAMARDFARQRSLPMPEVARNIERTWRPILESQTRFESAARASLPKHARRKS